MALALGSPAFAADYIGAAGVLEQLAAAAKRTPGEEKEKTPAEAWAARLKDFARISPTLEPKDAAARWLTLFDESDVLADFRRREYDPSDRTPGMADLFAVLPRPETWDALAAAIAARPLNAKDAVRGNALRMLGEMLSGDVAKLSPTMKDLQKAAVSETATVPINGYRTNGLASWVATLTEDAGVLGHLEEEIARFEKGEMSGGLEVPDLVTLIGAEKSEALLKRLLSLGSAELYVPLGDATREQAVRLATAMGAELKRPHWGLIHGISSAEVALYEVFLKRFPPTPDEMTRDYQRSLAEHLYLYGLIAAGRTADAAKLAIETSGRSAERTSTFSDVTPLINAGLTSQVQAFMREMLSKDPGLPFWGEFIGLSARAGDAPGALAFLRETAARPGLLPEAREEVESRLWAALLAADDVEQGVKVLHEALAAKMAKAAAKTPGTGRVPGLPGLGTSSPTVADEAADLALKLCELGRLLQRPELIEEGLKNVKTILAEKGAGDSDSNDALAKTTTLLLNLNRGDEAEALALASAVKAAKAAPENQTFRGAQDRYLSSLLTIYHRAGRPEDVVKLLTDAPDWEALDLADVLTRSAAGEQSLGYLAASSFAATGRKDEARKTVIALLSVEGGFDPGYELLLQLDGQAAMPALDRLAARDRFEERPLIWKAKLHLDAGQLEDAEKTIRAAIAIDPSDGEQGKGTRMRAYAILGDILEKRGDPAQAKTVRGAVEAIRLSEDADDWWEAGLLTRAVTMYEAALGHFADAYCIQSRLALHYSELGDEAKAELHYRRAYELMPESFGRVESHCFGCEGVFNGTRAQSIADKVFTKLAQTMPDKPQVSYLLAYLREEQGNYQEAAKLYRAAVKLDPQYLNAWEKLLALASRIAIPRADRQAAALAILRLDPLSRHGDHGFSDLGVRGKYGSITDLPALWKVLADTAALRSPPRVELFPLTATAADIERRRKAAAAAGMPSDPSVWTNSQSLPPATPSAALAEHVFLTELAQILQSR